MKALEKDRNRRYGTATSFAADIQCYLNDEAVQACPPSSAYRFRKFARRNKAALITTTAVASALVLGTLFSTWQAIRATRALEAESEARQQATTISQLLQEGLASANPDAAKGVDYTVRQLLDAISTRLGDQFQNQPAAEAAIRATIGNAYRSLELWDQAAPHLKRALELREKLFGPEHIEVARSLLDEGWNVMYRGGDWEGAEARARRCLAIHRQLDIRNVETVRALNLVQLTLSRQGRVDESDQAAREGLAIAKEQPNAVPEIASILGHMAHTMRYRGEYVEAERLARESVLLHREFNESHHPGTGFALLLLGRSLRLQEKYDEAEPYLRDAIAIFAEQYHDIGQGWVGAIDDLVLALEAKGDKSGMESLRADVSARARETLRLRPHNTGPLFYTAWAQLFVGDSDGATEILSHILATNPGKLKLPRDAMNHVAWRLATHSDSTQQKGKLAVELANKLVDLTPEVGRLWTTLGAAQYRAGDWQAAIKSLEKSTELREGGNSLDWFFLSMAHWQLGHKEEARQWYDKAVEWMEKNRPENEELLRFRGEAAELLGITEPPPANESVTQSAETKKTDDSKSTSTATTDN
jgi:tetratricopeptide (TPR) repeat protein